MLTWDATEIAARIAAREVKAVEVLDAVLDRIQETQPRLNSFTVVLGDEARAQALAADEAVARGAPLGPLHGVPVSIKDVIWVADVPATQGSRAFDGYRPQADAVPVARLRQAGAVIVGKTNNPEMCLGGYCANDVFGVSRNPWDPDRTPGGSSGGAAASVAAGAGALALGTDGGGSIRTPASYCGVVGCKPTFGVVPDAPGFRGWRTLSVVGPIARTVRDASLALGVIAGPHPADPATLGVSRPTGSRAGGRPVGELRIAASVDLGFAPVAPDVRAAFAGAVEALRGEGLRLDEAWPQTGDPAELWTRVASAEGSAAYAALLDRRHLLEERTAAIIDARSASPAAEYLDALEERREFASTWAEFFSRYDILITPTMQDTAFPAEDVMPATIDGNTVDPDLEDWCQFLLPLNLTGQPAVTIPCGTDRHGLPIGLQIIGRHGDEATVLAVAEAYEQIAGWSGLPDTIARSTTRSPAPR
ncbi:MAG TPA: amidase [Solirubrobacteraceae bacterium]|nr:amidase [Solirubrobacteraceae bacterium]